jgi:hypothetical protein
MLEWLLATHSTKMVLVSMLLTGRGQPSTACKLLITKFRLPRQQYDLMGFFHVLSTGVPTRYKNITVHIAGDSFDSQVVLNFGSVNRAALEALLIRRGADTFLDPVTKRRVDFSGIELSDNMLLSALRGDVPLEARVGRSAGHHVAIFPLFVALVLKLLFVRCGRRSE